MGDQLGWIGAYFNKDKQQKFQEFVNKIIHPFDISTKERDDSPFHVTLKYGFKPKDYNKIEDAVKLTSMHKIKGVLGKTSIFENDDFDVVKIEVLGPDLHRFNKLISMQFNIDDTHSEYRPHVTLAYVLPGEGYKYEGYTTFEGIPFIFNKICFSDHKENKTMINLPDSPNIIKSAFAMGFLKKTAQSRTIWQEIAGDPSGALVGLAATGGLGSLIGAFSSKNRGKGALYGLTQGIGMPLGALVGYGMGYDFPSTASHWGMRQTMGGGGATAGAYGAKKLIDALWGRELSQ